MNGNDLKHLGFIAWTSTILSADVPHYWEVNREEQSIKPPYSISKIDVYLIYKASALL